MAQIILLSVTFNYGIWHLTFSHENSRKWHAHLPQISLFISRYSFNVCLGNFSHLMTLFTVQQIRLSTLRDVDQPLTWALKESTESFWHITKFIWTRFKQGKEINVSLNWMRLWGSFSRYLHRYKSFARLCLVESKEARKREKKKKSIYGRCWMKESGKIKILALLWQVCVWSGPHCWAFKEFVLNLHFWASMKIPFEP